VTDGAVGPVALAMVGVTQDGTLLGAGLTDATGTAVFPIDGPLPGSDLLVRVTAHNHLPTDAATMVAAGSDGVVVLDSTVYRCDSPVVIKVFDEDLDGAPPFDVTLSAAPSGGAVAVQVTSVGGGVVQYQGTAVLGADLVVAHGDVLTVTYHDADTGGGSPADKTDTAVLDCAGPVVSNVQLTPGLGSLTLTFDTDEAGTTEVYYGTTMPPSTLVASPGLETSHAVVINGTDPCTTYYFSIHTADALGNLTVDDNGGSYHSFTTGGEAGVVVDANDTPVAIPDNDPTGASSFITIDAGFTILDVDVVVDITHTYTGDLDLYLIGPAGTTVLLSDQHGGSGDNYTGTHFDDEATTPIASGSSPFTGSFQPDQPLAAFDGLPAAGVWTFKVVDNYGYDVGTIDAWQIRLTLDAPCDGLFSDGFESGSCGAWSLAVGVIP
jgi:subtilisin-like proprotein convertase family protein